MRSLVIPAIIIITIVPTMIILLVFSMVGTRRPQRIKRIESGPHSHHKCMMHDWTSVSLLYKLQPLFIQEKLGTDVIKSHHVRQLGKSVNKQVMIYTQPIQSVLIKIQVQDMSMCGG